MVYDSVDHEHLENVVFCMGCDGIGLQRLMSTAKAFTLRVIGSQSVSVPSSRERGVGQGCPLAPLLFALAIEPLSRMLKQTMTGMLIDRIHVKQDTTHTVVAMCADDTPIFVFFFHNQILWASASEPAGSVPTTQSQKREVGTIAPWPHARAC